MPDFTLLNIESLNDFLMELHTIDDIKVRRGKKFRAMWYRYCPAEETGDFVWGTWEISRWEISRVTGSCFITFSVPRDWVFMKEGEVLFRLDEEEGALPFEKIVREDLLAELWEDVVELVDLNMPAGETNNNLWTDFDLVFGKSAMVRKGDEAEITIEAELEYRG